MVYPLVYKGIIRKFYEILTKIINKDLSILKNRTNYVRYILPQENGAGEGI